MTAPRRPAAGRRPATRGRTARSSRPVSGRSRVVAGAPHDRADARSGLTHRAAVLVLVVTTLVLSAALPVREFLDQRSAIAELEASADATRARVVELEEQKRQLDDPAHIAAEARRRLHMARPGEVGYVLLVPEPVLPAPQEQAGAGPDDPWWAQVWGSVEAADRPQAEDAGEDAAGEDAAPEQP